MNTKTDHKAAITGGFGEYTKTMEFQNKIHNEDIQIPLKEKYGTLSRKPTLVLESRTPDCESPEESEFDEDS